MGEEKVNVVKIFVGGLPSSCDNDKLTEYFGKYGRITDGVVMMDRQTQRHRGFGYCTFEDSSSVEAVMAEYKDHRIDGKWIEVKRCIPQDQMKDGGGGRGKGSSRRRSRSRSRSPRDSRSSPGGYPAPPGAPAGYPGYDPYAAWYAAAARGGDPYAAYYAQGYPPHPAYGAYGYPPPAGYPMGGYPGYPAYGAMPAYGQDPRNPYGAAPQPAPGGAAPPAQGALPAPQDGYRPPPSESL